ncbi:MAG TPA: T9SS type A sorting domain-containing protein, partial [Flavobacteriales bacterium]|nr:T9SS type A sorting domain-containing protein [Flavobacteriales bacterium]
VGQGFMRSYRTSITSYGSALRLTHDGGFLVGGNGNSTESGENSPFLVRTGPTGDTLWTRIYGVQGIASCNSVEAIASGGYFVVGQSQSTAAVPPDIMLLRADEDGLPLWCRTIGGPYQDVAMASTLTEDGGVAVAGWRMTASGEGNAYVVRFNADGDTLWTRTYDTGEGSTAMSICNTSDGGFALAGIHTTPIPDFRAPWIMRIDANGTPLWNTVLDLTLSDAAWISPLADGGFIVTGHLYSSVTFLARINGTGAAEWVRSYDLPNTDNKAYCVQPTADGGYALCGHNGGHPWMALTDEQGDVLWQRIYGDEIKTRNQLVVVGEDGFAMVSNKNWDGLGMQLIRTDADGRNGCEGHLPLVVADLTVETFSPTVVSGSYGIITEVDPRVSSGCSVHVTCSSTGMVDEPNEGFRIHPNPSSGRLFVSGIEGPFRCEVVDITGKVVGPRVAFATAGTIDVGTLAQGKYVLRLTRENGSVVHRSFIKE